MSATAMETSEKGFQGAVIDLAKHAGWRVAHFHDSRRQVRPGVFVGDTASKGFPDLVLARAPRLVIAELKREKGRVSAAQRDWLMELQDIVSFQPFVAGWDGGLEVYVWRPRAWEQIEKVLA